MVDKNKVFNEDECMKEETAYDLLKQTYTVVNRVEDKLDKLESRVSIIEIWRATIVGQVIVLLAIINLALAISFDWLKKQIFGDKI